MFTGRGSKMGIPEEIQEEKKNRKRRRSEEKGNSEEGIEPSDISCSICLDTIDGAEGTEETHTDNVEELQVLPCTHRFHLVCIKEWLRDVSIYYY
jgi:hypothetical protein